MVEASPLVIVFWRVAFGAAAVLVYLATTGRLRELSRLDRRGVAALLAVGVLITVNWILFLGALTLTQVAVAELLGYTGPVFVAALAPLVTREPYDRRIALPLVLALAGTAIIVGLGDVTFGGGSSALGAGMAFCSALTYAGLMLTGKRLLRNISAPVLAFGEYAFATVVLLPAALLLPGPSSPKEWGGLVTLGLVHTALAVLIFFSGLRHVRADQAGVFMYAEPVTAVLFAAVFLSEPLTWVTAVGGAGVVAAGVLVARMAPATSPPTTGMEAPTVPETLESSGMVGDTIGSTDSDRSEA
jgi:drug/metabolite transporter (DMT)-like permease